MEGHLGIGLREYIEYVCIYIYNIILYIYITLYVYIYIYMYTQTCRCWVSGLGFYRSPVEKNSVSGLRVRRSLFGLGLQGFGVLKSPEGSGFYKGPCRVYGSRLCSCKAPARILCRV